MRVSVAAQFHFENFGGSGSQQRNMPIFKISAYDAASF
jgi:hypothetical protein